MTSCQSVTVAILYLVSFSSHLTLSDITTSKSIDCTGVPIDIS